MGPAGHILIGLLIVVALGIVSLKYVPERFRDEQLVWRTSCILTLVCCYTMWVVTYMAQMNPLIVPERTWAPSSLADDS